jgi:hypothetical protein
VLDQPGVVDVSTTSVRVSAGRTGGTFRRPQSDRTERTAQPRACRRGGRARGEEVRRVMPPGGVKVFGRGPRPKPFPGHYASPKVNHYETLKGQRAMDGTERTEDRVGVSTASPPGRCQVCRASLPVARTGRPRLRCPTCRPPTRKPPRTCRVCGRLVRRPRARTCDDKCATIWRVRQTYRPCPSCGGLMRCESTECARCRLKLLGPGRRTDR